MQKQHVIPALLFLALSIPAFAADLNCSIKPAKDAKPAALQKLAKVTQAEAEKTALARIKAASMKVKSGDLEVERGCLVYSFDIAVAGRRGVEEILVDAGTGKVLSRKHETAKQEAAEQAKDKAAAKK
jgi:hypothetical protein